MLVDICCKVRILVCKEHRWGFRKRGINLRLADLLLINWLYGKDVCVDVIEGSPFTGTSFSQWVHSASLANIAERKRKKCTTKCEEYGCKFILSSFYTFKKLSEDALDLLSRIASFSLSNSNNPMSRAYIFHRLAFCI